MSAPEKLCADCSHAREPQRPHGETRDDTRWADRWCFRFEIYVSPTTANACQHYEERPA